MADDIKLVIDVDDRSVIKSIKNQEKLEKEIMDTAKGLKRLKDALATGMISQSKFDKGTAQVNSRISHLTKTLYSGAGAIDQWATHVNQAKNKTNRFGMVAQQVGYQVGDFFVQVQSGTSALVAFGQQGTQLAGLLPGVAGAVVGIGMSLGTMLLKTFLDTRDAGKQLEESVKAVEEALSDLSNVSSMLRDTLGAPFSEANTVLREYLELLEKSSAANVQKQVSLAFGAKGESTGILNELALMAEDMTEPPWWAGEKFGGSKKEIEDANELLRVRGEIAEILRGTAEQPRIIEGTEGLRELGDDLLAYSKKFNGALGERIRTLMFEAGLTKLMVDDEKAKGDAANDALEKHATEMEAFYDMIAKEDKDEAKRKSDLMKKQWDALYKNRMEAKKAAEEASKREATAIASSKVQIEQASVRQALQEAELQYGSKSIEHREAQVKAAKELARITAEQKFIADGITDAEQDQIDLLVEAAGEAEVMRQALADSKIEAGGLAKNLRSAVSALNSLMGLGDSIDKAIAVAQVRLGTLQITGDSKMADIAAGIEGQRQDLQKFYDKAFEGLSAGTPEFSKLVDERFEANQKLYALEGYLELIEEENDRIKESNKSGRKGKKKPGLIMTEELFAMKQKLDLQTASLGKSEEEILFEQNKSQLLSKITDQMVGMSEVDKAFYIQQAEGAAEYITNKQLELIALQEIEQQQEKVADTIANSMGNALMSMVDGTKSVKDAFKSMASDIIKDLYRILVVEQMVKSIKTATLGFFEDGGVFQGGSQVQAYADGGVVGSPTTFPMAGGRTGLMGEAGPEAIMPLKRGANGKLGVQAEGGAGDVVIHQNFNFTANGDESVKKLIAQAAPQIASMTKSSIISDRRRGGQMKATFG